MRSCCCLKSRKRPPISTSRANGCQIPATAPKFQFSEIAPNSRNFWWSKGEYAAQNCIVLKRLENTQIGGWPLGFGFRFGMFGFGILHPDGKAGRRICRSLEEFGRYMLYIQNAMWRNKRFGFRYLLCQGKWLLWGLIGSDEFVGNSKIPCALGRNALMHYANSE